MPDIGRKHFFWQGPANLYFHWDCMRVIAVQDLPHQYMVLLILVNQSSLSVHSGFPVVFRLLTLVDTYWPFTQMWKVLCKPIGWTFQTTIGLVLKVDLWGSLHSLDMGCKHFSVLWFAYYSINIFWWMMSIL